MNYKKALSAILVICILGWIGWYTLSHWDEFGGYKDLSWSAATGLLISTFLYLVCQGLILKVVLIPFKIGLRMKEWLGIMVITLLGNYIFPFAGLGFRAEYLKKKHELTYTDFASTLTAIQIMEFLVFTVGGLLGLIYVYFQNGLFDPGLTALFGAVFLGCLTAFLFSPRFQFEHRILKKITSILDSWYRVKRNRRLMITLFWATCLEFITYCIMFYFAFASFGLEVGFISTFIPSCLSDYSFLIRLTPASFGFYEGSVVYTAKFLGMTLPQGLLVVGLIRATTMIIVFCLGPIFSYILMRKNSK